MTQLQIDPTPLSPSFGNRLGSLKIVGVEFWIFGSGQPWGDGAAILVILLQTLDPSSSADDDS